MRAMTEREFMGQIGRGNRSGLVIETLMTFLRSHNFYDVANACEILEDRYQDRSDYEYFEEAIADDTVECSDGGGI